MEKYPEELCDQMRTIYKAVIKRIASTGKTEESDMLFIAFFKQNIEQNTKIRSD